MIYFTAACGPFHEGDRVLVDPTDSFAPGEWMLIECRGETWWGGGQVAGKEKRLVKPDGEVVIFDATRHVVRGVIVGKLDRPPSVPSA